MNRTTNGTDFVRVDEIRYTFTVIFEKCTSHPEHSHA